MRKKTGKMRFLSVLLSLSLMFQTGAFVSDGIPGGTAYAQEALPGEDSEKDTETTEAAAGEITETTTEETTGTASGETTETTTEETTAEETTAEETTAEETTTEETTTEETTTEETTTEETTTEEATETLPPNRLPMGADQQRGREPLESVVKEMYTTLYDMDHRIVDTNDPQYEKDSMYVPEEEGGEGATVDLGEGLYVRFRMADILEHEDGDGVQEGTVYYMSLPEELVPQAEDEEGNRLVDPDEPLTFIDNGMISARGGIYTADGGYELQVAFFDVEDKIDISGEFQYAVSVDESLEPGKEYELTYVPGGHDKRMSK